MVLMGAFSETSPGTLCRQKRCPKDSLPVPPPSIQLNHKSHSNWGQGDTTRMGKY